MTMELPECHDAAIEKAAKAYWSAGGLDTKLWMRAAIAAYLSALKEQQMALDVTALWKSSGDVLATNGLENIAGLVPALIIRMEQK